MAVDRQKLLSIISQIEVQQQDLVRKVSQVAAACLELMEENNILKVENSNLRSSFLENIDENNTDDKLKTKNKIFEPAYANLVNLYDEGFHICNDQFGRPRNGECIFCTVYFKKG